MENILLYFWLNYIHTEVTVSIGYQKPQQQSFYYLDKKAVVKMYLVILGTKTKMMLKP